MGLFSTFDDKFFTLKLKKREFTEWISPLVKGCINKASLSSEFVNKKSKPLELWKICNRDPKKIVFGVLYDTIACGENAPSHTFPQLRAWFAVHLVWTELQEQNKVTHDHRIIRTNLCTVQFNYLQYTLIRMKISLILQEQNIVTWPTYNSYLSVYSTVYLFTYTLWRHFYSIELSELTVQESACSAWSTWATYITCDQKP